MWLGDDQVYVEKLVKTAHENYMRDVVEYDGEALIERASSLRGGSTQVVEPIRAQGSGSGNLQAQVGGGQLQAIPSTQGASTSQVHEISYPAVSARNGEFFNLYPFSCFRFDTPFYDQFLNGKFYSVRAGQFNDGAEGPLLSR